MQKFTALLKSVIIDDEEGARKSLANILKKYFPEVEVAAVADSAKSGFEIISEEHPDLVFLDVQMPGGNAFDLLSQFKKIDFKIIFVTAYDHYAIQAIKFSALDYLLKPVDIDDLREALNRIKKNESSDEKFKVLLNNLKTQNRKVAIPDMEGLLFVPVDDIVRCESDGSYTTIITTDGKKIISSHPIAYYDELLEHGNFFRIHRSHLINLDHVKKYFRGVPGYITMSDNASIDISRKKKNEFLERFGK